MELCHPNYYMINSASKVGDKQKKSLGWHCLNCFYSNQAHIGWQDTQILVVSVLSVSCLTGVRTIKSDNVQSEVEYFLKIDFYLDPYVREEQEIITLAVTLH